MMSNFFANNKKELVQTVRIFNQDIGIEFVIGKNVMLIMNKGKREKTESVESPNQERIKTLGEKTINN